MLKVALLAAAVVLATTAATATNTAVDSATTPTAPADPPCRPGPTLELACALRAADAGAAPAADLASVAAPPAAVDWAPPPSTEDLAFKDAAADTGSVLLAGVDRSRSQHLAPALLAIAALVVLLRRRPTWAPAAIPGGR